jgi:glucosamine--fructose-6-phosphate aminotransferase (isomerizing)
MNRTDAKYTNLKIIGEMLETAEIICRFDFNQAAAVAADINAAGRLLMTGEGSSRLFPAKNAIDQAMRWGLDLRLHTDGARQAAEYDLSDFAVFGASNSGKTKEVVALFDRLTKAGHQNLYALTANADTPLTKLAKKDFILTCGKEVAVAATKSVVEQALFYHALIAQIAGRQSLAEKLPTVGCKFQGVLEAPIDPDIIKTIAAAKTIYFAGRNTGVAEELTLKTNETTRKPSGYLEGTYAVHGIEEVMTPDEVVIVVSPFADEVEKFNEVLVDGVGMAVIAIHHEDTIFPTINIPNDPDFTPYYEMAAGWSVLIETGIALNVDVDHPQRARKVGNEFTG